MNIPDDFKRSIEYAAADQFGLVEAWTIRYEAEHVYLEDRWTLKRRVVYYGPWEDA